MLTKCVAVRCESPGSHPLRFKAGWPVVTASLALLDRRYVWLMDTGSQLLHQTLPSSE